MGIVLHKATNKGFIQGQLNVMFSTVKHSSQIEREVGSFTYVPVHVLMFVSFPDFKFAFDFAALPSSLFPVCLCLYLFVCLLCLHLFVYLSLLPCLHETRLHEVNIISQ